MIEPLRKYECLALVLGFMGVVVAALTGAAIFCQARISSQTLNEVKDSRRPWVGIDGTPVMRQESEDWKVDFTVKNVGLSPGLHAVPSGGAEDITSTDSMKSAIESFCAIGEGLTLSEENSSGPPSEGHGYTLFPGSVLPQSLSVKYNKTRPVYFLGCITYLDQSGKKPIHHARYCYFARPPLGDGELLAPCFAGWNAD